MAWIEEFLDEYNSIRYQNRAERRQERALRASVSETSFIQNAHNPASVIDMYGADESWPRTTFAAPQAPVNIWTGAGVAFDPEAATQAIQQSQGLTDLGNQIRSQHSARAIEFASEVERVYYENREEIPIEWIMQQDPEDFHLLGGEFAETAKYLERVERYEAAHLVNQQAIEEETDRRMESYQRRSEYARLVGRAWDFFTPGEQYSEQIETAADVATNTISREEVLEQVRQEFLGTVENPVQERNFFESAWEWLQTSPATWQAQGSVQLLGKGLNATSNMLDGAMNAITSAALGFDTEGLMHPEQIEELENLRAQQGMPDMQRLEELSIHSSEVAWEMLQQENPEEAGIYMAMAGGDPARAFAYFGADLTEMPEVQAQLQKALDEEDESLRAYIDLMEEQDYRVSGDLLDIMAAYGKYVPMQLATAAGILLTDEDMRSGPVAERWAQLGEEVAEADYTPSRALGLDGTFVGLGLDLGAGIAFDPLTWVFGPRLNNANATMSTADEVVRLSRTAAVRRTVDDLVNVARSPSHGDMEVALIASFLDPVPGATDDLLDTLGIVSRQLPDRPWASSSSVARSTQEVRLAALVDNLDEATYARLGQETAPEALVSSIAETGFESPLTIGVSREGNLYLMDGVKRIEAAMELQLQAVPVRVQLLDDVPTDQLGTMLTGDVADRARRLFDLPDTGERFVRPGQLFDHEFIYGAVDKEKVTEIITNAMLNGAQLPSATRLATAAHTTSNLRQTLRSMGAPGRWLDRYMSPQLTVSTLELHGPTAMPKAVETIVRLGGDDTGFVDRWVSRLFQARRNSRNIETQYMDDLARGAQLRAEVEALESLNGGGWDDVMRHLQDEVDSLGPSATPPGGTLADDFDQAAQYDPRPLPDGAGEVDAPIETLMDPEPSINRVRRNQLNEQSRQARINQSQARSALNIKKAELDDLYKKLDQMRYEADRVKATSMQQVMQDMFDDYNREVLAKMKSWKKYVDPETGMVPWEYLRRGVTRADGAHEGVRSIFPKAKADASGINAEAAYRDVSTIQQLPMKVDLPVSPLDLLIASEYGGAKYTQFARWRLGRVTRDSLQGMHAIWVLDKVMRPATAIAVSADEWLRIFHQGGLNAVQRYARDKALFARARSAAVRHGQKPTVARGAEYLSAASQRRLMELADYPTLYKQAERQIFDNIGLGWDDILPSDPNYAEAAERWAAQMIQDSGFRAFLRGEDAFREWFLGPDGYHIRRATALGPKGTHTLSDWRDAYQGWKTVYEKVVLSEARASGKWELVDQGFRKAAQLVDEGNRAASLPQSAIRHLGAVRGVRKHATTGGLPTRMADAFFDKFFMDPVNYRRGFLADLARKKERARLMRLFASQGKRVVPNTELDEVLSAYGFSSASSSGARSYVTEVAMRNGIVPESYIDDLVEMRVVEEIDNTLFTWDQGSRMGQQGKVIFPFGRPWADMAGFWGREVLTKPALRGMFSNRVTEQLTSKMLFNPKPLATWSRLAATDFSVEETAPGVPLPFGAEELDFSPLLFIPTEGSNPFGMVLPGLGYVPLWFIDRLIYNTVDPLQDPSEYEALIGAISDFIPAVQFQRGGTLARIAGGGNLRTAALAFSDISGGLGGTPFYNLTSEFGDISREIDRARSVSSALIQPGVMEEIMGMTDSDLTQEYIDSLVLKADRDASTAHLSELAVRTAIPARAVYDLQADELQELWVDAQERFPEDLPVDLTRYDMEDPDQVRQAADDVRDAFFELPQWKRDVMIAQYPQMAVNLIGNWEWTPLAVNTLPGNETLTSYRTAGDRESLDRHQYYIDNSYIRPLQPKERVNRILGMIQASQESAAKQIYESTAEFINDALWASLPEESVSLFDRLARDPEIAELGFTDGQSVWRNWRDIEDRLEARFIEQAREANPDMDEEQFAELSKSITEGVNFPQRLQAWGSSWPGLDDEELSGKFQAVRLNEFPEDVVEIAAALDIELTPGMTGLQLFSGVVDAITEVDSPAFQAGRYAYNRYMRERTAGSETAEAQLSQLRHDPNLDPEWQSELTRFLDLTEQIESDMIRKPDFRPSYQQQTEVAEQFRNLMMTTDLPVDWDLVWTHKFERTYGPYDWTPPQLPTVFLEDGEMNPNAWAPYVNQIIDGDTLIVSENPADNRVMGTTYQPRMRSVRLLGVNARELNGEGGSEDKQRLVDALTQALENGDRIYLVRDPDTFGTNTDQYGRELAYLYIGDEPFYFEEELIRTLTPSGRDQ